MVDYVIHVTSTFSQQVGMVLDRLLKADPDQSRTEEYIDIACKEVRQTYQYNDVFALQFISGVYDDTYQVYANLLGQSSKEVEPYNDLDGGIKVVWLKSS